MAGQIAHPRGRRLVVFGDSLSDEGTFGFRFTTQPGRTWVYHVARHVGHPCEPAVVCNYADAFVGRTRNGAAGAGLNFAQGGARVALPYSAASEEPAGIPWSVAVQIDEFLKVHGRFQDDQVAVVFAGTNDVTYRYDPAIDPALAAQLRDNQPASAKNLRSDERRMRRAAADLVAHVGRIRRAHAPNVVVLGLFDLSAAPWFRTAAARQYIARLTEVFNIALKTELDDINDTATTFFDTAAVFDPILSNPTSYGFAHGRGVDACGATEADALDFCDVASQRSVTAHRDCVFAASLHLSTAAHEVLAQRVIAECLPGGVGGSHTPDVTSIAFKGQVR